MKPLFVKCPQCKEVSELFLGSEAYMIVLNCPSCNAALMYYYGKTFEIDESDRYETGFALITIDERTGKCQNIRAELRIENLG